jgi:hypothetical protein
LGQKEEDVVAHRAAGRLAAALNCNVAVCCGIHVDAISAVELEFNDRAHRRGIDRF